MLSKCYIFKQIQNFDILVLFSSSPDETYLQKGERPGYPGLDSVIRQIGAHGTRAIWDEVAPLPT